MKKGSVIAVFLTLVLLLPLLRVPASAVSGNDYCYPYAQQLTDNNFRYLNEIYIEKFPEMGLRWTQGTDEDKWVLTKLANIITEGCNTDKEKAEAIAGWIKRNITYVEGSSCFYAIDSFYTRSGNCASYAQLMQTLLRLEGISAVYGDGFRMDTQTTTVSEIQEQYTGHAWCFAYIGGEWLLYDPLWEGSIGISDRDYLAKHYYLETVDRIVPVYDINNIPPVSDPDTLFVYADGKFMFYSNGMVNSECSNVNIGINSNGKHCFSICDYYYDDPNGNQIWTYVDNPERMVDMIPGEVYTGGWFWRDTAQSDLKYAYENGVQAHGIIMEFHGELYYMNQSSSHRLLIDEDSYYIRNGFLHVTPGYCGKITEPYDYDSLVDSDTMEYNWVCEDTDIATVDQNGVITSTGKEGLATILITGTRRSTGFTYNAYVMYVYFRYNNRVADYSDWEEPEVHSCSYTVSASLEPTCDTRGSVTYSCTCGSSYVEYTDALGHVFSEWIIDLYPTETQDGVRYRYCYRCYHNEPEVIPAGTKISPDDPDIHVCNFVAVEVVEPNCDEFGYTIYCCTECGNETVDNITTTGHHYTPWEVIEKATNDSPGLQVRWCEYCGLTEEQIIPTLSGGVVTPDNDQDNGHSCVFGAEETVDPTCEEPGYTLYQCDCGDQYILQTAAPLGHNWQTDRDSNQTAICQQCGKVDVNSDNIDTPAESQPQDDTEPTESQQFTQQQEPADTVVSTASSEPTAIPHPNPNASETSPMDTVEPNGYDSTDIDADSNDNEPLVWVIPAATAILTGSGAVMFWYKKKRR